MSVGQTAAHLPSQGLDEHLIVDEFLCDPLRSEMLSVAFDCGLIDALSGDRPVAIQVLASGVAMDHSGFDFMIAALVLSGVLVRHSPPPAPADHAAESASQPIDTLSWSPRFRQAMRFRDLLEVKLDLARLVGEDFQQRLASFLAADEAFFRQSRLFELFDYGRCFEVTPANCMATWRWVRLTTVLTRYEALAIDHLFDFSRHRRWLDLGGNSGELAAQIVARHEALAATVFDLPVVCEVGRRHLANHPHGNRIAFVPGDLRADPLPGGFDLITCKSLLHDWPEAEVLRILTQVRRALAPGGKLMIFERQADDAIANRLQFGMLPVLMFFRSYRSPVIYQGMLQQAGFVDVKLQCLTLDWPFMMLTAMNPGG